jgi:serine O-acetyltransferase
VWEGLREDYRAVRRRDPSIPRGIRGTLEILLCTPGFLAVSAHRLNHYLHVRLRVPVLPRFLALIVRWWTGIEIHPGARLGNGVFIDHGMGVVIGESAEIGDNVLLFQGVTLGATGKETTWKRHPTLESGVFVGSGARILGPVVIGRNARVGAGAIVLENVPPEATAVGQKARIRSLRGSGALPSHEAVPLQVLTEKVARLERELNALRNAPRMK